MICPICNSEDVTKRGDFRHCNYCFFTWKVGDDLKIVEPTEEDKEEAERYGWTIRTRDELIEVVIDLIDDSVPSSLSSLLDELGVDISVLKEKVYYTLADMDYLELFRRAKRAIATYGWKAVVS